MLSKIIGTTTHVFDVAIIGYGPTGAVLANLLGQAGLHVLVIEKEAGIYPLPRAIHFDGEVMRVFQNAGLRDEVLAVTRPGHAGMHFVNAQGETLLVRRGSAALGPHGCANNYYFHQPALEAVLRTGVTLFPNVQMSLGHELVDLCEEPDRVVLGVREAASGVMHAWSARHVVGCDGARSRVRAAMDSSMRDLGLRQPWLVFDVLLKRPVALPEYTVQHCDPARPSTFCNVVGNRRRWEIMLLPGDDPTDLVRPERLWQWAARWGVRPDNAELERAMIYTFQSVIAERWRRGRLLLAGDACHQMPPFLGQGMCAGIRDAANLAWKLVAVSQGRAGASLLDSYESERVPHVQAFIELAVSLGTIIQTTDPAAAAERDAKFRAGRPEVFEFPAPTLGPGLCDAGEGPPVGRPFPQPRLADERLLDEHIGQRFAVIGHADALQAASAQARGCWAEAGAIAITSDAEPALAQWLSEHRACAVVLRPDRYIVGLAATVDDLERISPHLQLP